MGGLKIEDAKLLVDSFEPEKLFPIKKDNTKNVEKKENSILISILDFFSKHENSELFV